MAPNPFLNSDEWRTDEKELAIIKACRKADPECVQRTGDSMVSFERSKASQFVPMIKACEGDGMGK